MLHELKLIVDLLHEGGLAKMHQYISHTAKYGDLTRGPRIVNKATKKEMKKILDEIQDGNVRARQWIRENKTGRKKYDALMKKDLAHPIEKVGAKLRARMPWLNRAESRSPLQTTTVTTMSNRDPNRVLIFDTTLRDGEQSPGCSMTLPEKLQMARALAELGVDVIEAGFPIASPGDFEAVREIAREVRGPIICGPGPLQPRGHRPALERGQGGREAAHPRLPRHQRDPSRVQAQDGQGRDHRTRPSKA